MALKQIVEYLGEELGVKTSQSAVGRFLTKDNITYKKRQRKQVSKIDQM